MISRINFGTHREVPTLAVVALMCGDQNTAITGFGKGQGCEFTRAMVVFNRAQITVKIHLWLRTEEVR